MVKNKGKAWEVLQKERLNEPPHETPEQLTDRALKKIHLAHEIKASDSADREDSAGASIKKCVKFLAPAAETGFKVLDGVRQAREFAHGTPEEQKRRWQKYWDDCLAVFAEHPRWGVTAIREEVIENYKAENHKVSYKTIERHTPGLRDYLNRRRPISRQ